VTSIFKVPSPLVGADWFKTLTVTESPATPINVLEIVTEAVSPAVIDAEVADKVIVSELAVIVADEGPVERTPSPNAVTTTSARRLNVSFDISFLSIVVLKTFLSTADREKISVS